MNIFWSRERLSEVLLIVMSVICVCHTSSHLRTRTFTSSHITSSYLHLHILTSSHTHTFTLTHFHIFTNSHLLFFSLSLSHLHIFTHIFKLTLSYLPSLTSSHTDICFFFLSHSHLHIFTFSLSLPSFLSPFSLPFLSLAFFIFSLQAEGGAGEESWNVNPFARNEGRCAKTKV